MKNNILINDIINNVNDCLLDFNYYYTIKNLKKRKKK